MVRTTTELDGRARSSSSSQAPVSPEKPRQASLAVQSLPSSSQDEEPAHSSDRREPTHRVIQNFEITRRLRHGLAVLDIGPKHVVVHLCAFRRSQQKQLQVRGALLPSFFPNSTQQVTSSQRCARSENSTSPIVVVDICPGKVQNATLSDNCTSDAARRGVQCAARAPKAARAVGSPPGRRPGVVGVGRKPFRS